MRPRLLKALWLSPWSRHPAFLFRKIRSKLGAKFPLAVRPLPPGVGQCPALPVAGLRAWIQSCDVTAEVPPWTRVFRQDFPIEFLLERCRASKPLDPENLATLTRGGRGLRNDIKLPWEFSRGYSFVLQSAVAPPDRREAVARDIADQILLWEQHNRDLDGPNWICAMEVAIRAVNWTLADALLEGALSRQIGEPRWLGWLWTCGQVIEQRIEARKVSSNHYLSNLLGLSVLGLHFPGTAEGRRWRRFGVCEMQQALLRQTYGDGGLYESSLPYHALVTEMALLFALFAGDSLSSAFRARLQSMCGIVAAMLDVGGDVFPVGDEDGGRVVPLDFISQSLGRGQVVLKLAEQVFPGARFGKPAEALFPRSGWWVARRGDFGACLEFGGYGPCGYGSHAHNDTLSVLANYKGCRVLVDPGTYLYTSDPEARNRFRSARVHNVLSVDDQEPFPLATDLPGMFRLFGPDAPARLVGRGPGEVEVETEVKGCVAQIESHERPRSAGPPTLPEDKINNGPSGRDRGLAVRFWSWARGLKELSSWTRRVQIGEEGVRITDRWDATGAGPVVWTFCLAPGVAASLDGAGGFRLNTAAGPLRLSGSAPAWDGEIGEYEFSPVYGQRIICQKLRAVLRPGTNTGAFTWTLTAEPAA